jgi:hypothetical protein
MTCWINEKVYAKDHMAGLSNGDMRSILKFQEFTEPIRLHQVPDDSLSCALQKRLSLCTAQVGRTMPIVSGCTRQTGAGRTTPIVPRSVCETQACLGQAPENRHFKQ